MRLPAAVVAFLDAVRARDVDAVAACFTEDATYAYAVPHPPVQGRDAIRAMFDELLRTADRAQWDIVASTCDGDRVWTERVDRFWFEEREVAIECAGVFELAGDRIRAVRDYVDLQSWRTRREADEPAQVGRLHEGPATAGDAMTRHLLLVFADAADGQDEEFNRWYDEEHLPDVLEVPGFVRAQRFVAVPATRGQLPPHRYLAVYEIETDDLPSALAALSVAARDMHLSPAFDRAGSTQFAFTALGPAQEAR